MLTYPHSKFGRNSRALAGARATGFTLIELLVVVAIIAVLMSILLPSLTCAREQARSVLCGQKLRDLGNGMHNYFAENRDWIPGVNTTGVSVALATGLGAGWWNTPKLPVQRHDWMTPILSMNQTLPSNRVERWQFINQKFSCPSQKFSKAVVWGPGAGASADRSDFARFPNWTAMSYLMPVHFQFWGISFAGTRLGQISPTVAVEARTWPTGAAPPGLTIQDRGGAVWEADHLNYQSILTKVGNPSQKVAVADGTRYLAGGPSFMLDFDPTPNPWHFGSFTSGGAWWAGDTAYGVAANRANHNGRQVTRGNPSAGRNLSLSYRHGCSPARTAQDATSNKGSINSLFFDASVRKLSDKQSRSPLLWYPTGTIVRNVGEGLLDDMPAVGSLIP